ncbi:hypothetical protein D2Q93_07835 [Alicyclobacillaceae bacterium I2511]|nr:hypothetical protein D2Q93_07835 [Alicyclobacillaceae bacterium I2511]
MVALSSCTIRSLEHPQIHQKILKKSPSGGMMKMIQPNPNVKKVEKSTESVEYLFNTAWKSYNDRVAETEKFLQQRESDYIKSISETRKFLGETRKNAEGFTRDLWSENQKIFNEFGKAGQTEALNKTSGDSLSSMDEFLQRYQELAWTPWRSLVEFSEATEERWEDANRQAIKQAQDQRKSLTDTMQQFQTAAHKFQSQFLQTWMGPLHTVTTPGKE